MKSPFSAMKKSQQMWMLRPAIRPNPADPEMKIHCWYLGYFRRVPHPVAVPSLARWMPTSTSNFPLGISRLARTLKCILALSTSCFRILKRRPVGLMVEKLMFSFFFGAFPIFGLQQNLNPSKPVPRGAKASRSASSAAPSVLGKSNEGAAGDVSKCVEKEIWRQLL